MDKIVSQFVIPSTNTIVFVDGVCIQSLNNFNYFTFIDNVLIISNNYKNPHPLHILFLVTKTYNLEITIILEEYSYIEIIEEYVTLYPINCRSNVTINFKLEKNSTMKHYRIFTENNNHIDQCITTKFFQKYKSNATSVILNNELFKLNEQVNIKLEENYASYERQEIDLLKETQSFNKLVLIDHLAKNCNSNVIIKSILKDNAKENIHCKFTIRNGAEKTKTNFTNKNLLLSTDAKINSHPELEVYVDDVICTHGVTVGQLDQNALFYLRSRGFKEDLATWILIGSFIKEIFNRFFNHNRYKNNLGFIDE